MIGKSLLQGFNNINWYIIAVIDLFSITGPEGEISQSLCM
jgi:hypothetical protein